MDLVHSLLFAARLKVVVRCQRAESLVYRVYGVHHDPCVVVLTLKVKRDAYLTDCQPYGILVTSAKRHTVQN